MKKFLIFSLIVGVAGVGVGIARRHEATAVAQAVATAPTTAITAVPIEVPTTVTTATRIVLARPAAPTTTTTQRPAAPVTTTTTVRTPEVPVEKGYPFMTTPSTEPIPRCTASFTDPVEQPAREHGYEQTLVVTSAHPGRPLDIDLHGPYYFSAHPTTDAAGGASYGFDAVGSGKAGTPPHFYKMDATVYFLDAYGHHLSEAGCATTWKPPPT